MTEWNQDMSAAPRDGTWLELANNVFQNGKNVWLAFGTTDTDAWLGDAVISVPEPYAWRVVADPPEPIIEGGS